MAAKSYRIIQSYIAWKVSKYRVISSPYFPVLSPNTEKYGPQITSYLDAFHTVIETETFSWLAF